MACAGGEQHDTGDDSGTLGGDTVDSVTGVVATTTTAGESSSSSGEDGGESSSGAATTSTTDAGSSGTGDGECIPATLLWFDDFETGDYSRWSAGNYGADWHDGECHDNGFTDATFVSAGHSHRSAITCATPGESHRGYGIVQFAGDEPLQDITNAGVGIDAPFGVVNTFWSRVDVDYDFANGKWFSFWTVDDACDWSSEVVTLGLEDTTRRLTPAHLDMQTFEPDAPAFPFGAWARITIYIDYHAGEMHVWQDGVSVVHGTFTRPARRCASGTGARMRTATTTTSCSSKTTTICGSSMHRGPTSHASHSSDSRERLRAPLKEDEASVTAMSWHDVVVAR
ncbi:MAG TPA: hypothetical protein VG755_21835 [Nannocystaceae bacterium]|nr:hypothetical protein [Nannocystaceae bacterium]